MDLSFKIQCEKCNNEYQITNSMDNHINYVVCPLCQKEIYAASDYGYGPVWPGNIYLGDKLLLTINFDRFNKYEIKNSYNSIINIKLPRRYIKNNYVNHFKIVRYAYKKYKKINDNININIEWFNNIFIDNIKGLSYDAKRQIMITKNHENKNIFDLEDIADEVSFEYVRPMLENLIENNIIKDDIINIMKKIDEVFSIYSFGSSTYDESFWTEDGVMNHNGWEKLRGYAKQILYILEIKDN